MNESEIYQKGYRDGVKASTNADFRIMLSQVLNKTDGIGIKLYDRVMENAKEMLKDE